MSRNRKYCIFLVVAQLLRKPLLILGQQFFVCNLNWENLKLEGKDMYF